MPFSIRPRRRLSLAYFLGFWLLMTLLVLSTGPADAEWVLVHKGKDGMIVYVNPDTIRRKVEMVTMWALLDFKTVETFGDNQLFLSTKEKIEYDCDGERGRLLTFTHFSDHMGTGKAVYTDEGKGEVKWQPGEPKSVGQTLWNVACGKK
jgi:surface-adhesin protein E